MKATIYCKVTQQGVQEFFGYGVSLAQALDFSKSKKDTAVMKTMDKLPMYIKYIEKEYEIAVLNQTKKKRGRHTYHEESYCA